MFFDFPPSRTLPILKESPWWSHRTPHWNKTGGHTGYQGVSVTAGQLPPYFCPNAEECDHVEHTVTVLVVTQDARMCITVFLWYSIQHMVLVLTKSCNVQIMRSLENVSRSKGDNFLAAAEESISQRSLVDHQNQRQYIINEASIKFFLPLYLCYM